MVLWIIHYIMHRNNHSNVHYNTHDVLSKIIQAAKTLPDLWITTCLALCIASCITWCATVYIALCNTSLCTTTCIKYLCIRMHITPCAKLCMLPRPCITDESRYAFHIHCILHYVMYSNTDYIVFYVSYSNMHYIIHCNMHYNTDKDLQTLCMLLRSRRTY